MWRLLPLALALTALLPAADARFGLDDWFDALFPSPNVNDEEETRVQMIVLDLTPQAAAPLSLVDRRRACEVGVSQLQQQWALQHDVEQLRHRLRNPFLHGYERISVVAPAGETCLDFDNMEMRMECERVVQDESSVRRWIHRGKTSKAQICEAMVPADAKDVPGNTPTSPEPLSCKLCKRFVQMVVAALKKDLDQVEQVREILGDICDEMAADSMCHTFLQRYDDIVEWLKEGTDPAYVCPMIYMCPANEREVGAALVQAMDDKTCWFCDEVTTVLEVLVQEQPDKVDLVREYADLICKMLGDQAPCKKYDDQLDYAIDALKQRKTPREICQHLKYCSGGVSAPAIAMSASKEEQVQTIDSTAKALSFPSPQSFHSCFYCVHVTAVVRFVLQAQPGLIDTIRKIIQYGCRLTPEDCKCDDYVKSYDKIVAMLKAGKEPVQVCEAISMCKKKPSHGRKDLLDLLTTDRIAEEVASLVVPNESFDAALDMTCLNCHYFSTMIEIVIQERPQFMDEVREFADMICGMLGESSVCHKYVKQMDYVVDELEKGKKPGEICVALHYCNKSKMNIPAAPSLSRFDMKESELEPSMPRVTIDECFFCTTLGRFIKVAIDQNPSEVDQIRGIADLICRMLPAENKCHAIVSDMDKMIDSIRRGEDPATVCHDLHYCTKRASADKFPALPPPSVGSNKCAYCDGAVTILKYVLHQQPDVMENLREAAGIVCEMLPEEDQCHVYLKMYDSTLDALRDGKAPHAICQALKYCDQAVALPDAANAFSGLNLKQLISEASTPSVNIDGCFFCTMFGRFVKVAIDQNPDAVDQIRGIADLVCSMLPANNQCHAIVRKMDKMIDSVRRGDDPAVVCHDLKYCANRASAGYLPMLSPPSVGTNKCAYCDGLVTVLKYAIQEREDEMNELREAAGIVCDLLPKDDECHSDLQMYDKAVDDLKGGKEPHVICQELKFCKAKQGEANIASYSLGQMFTKASKKAEKSMSVGCLFCEYIAEILKHIHLDPKQQAQAKQALASMCTILPPSARCDILTSQFDALATMMREGSVSPSQACNKIGLCAAEWISTSDKPFEDTFPIGHSAELQ